MRGIPFAMFFLLGQILLAFIVSSLFLEVAYSLKFGKKKRASFIIQLIGPMLLYRNAFRKLIRRTSTWFFRIPIVAM